MRMIHCVESFVTEAAPADSGNFGARQTYPAGLLLGEFSTNLKENDTFSSPYFRIPFKLFEPF